jgi:NAD(P)H-dependent flavin oxidoreductase YrpB (nitropropane dioxygenase family)
MSVFQTPLTKLFGIQHPIVLAGMNVAAGPELAAAVTNAGGLGVIGGVGYTPTMLQAQIDDLKANLVDKNGVFGVDLLLPKVGGGARATNYDYTHGELPQLIDIIIASGARLFVSAVGVPPKWAVEKLHAANIIVMNMVGSPKHVPYALAAGADIIVAQGGEGGGHTGDVATSILLPKCVDAVRGKKSPLTGEQVMVIGAGGIFDGRGLAAALAYGCAGVWVGTRFICAKEAGASARHQEAVINAGFHDTVRTIIYTGRPLRVLKTPYIERWEKERGGEIERLTSQGVIPAAAELERGAEEGTMSPREILEARPLLMGSCAGAVNEVSSAAEIVEGMVREAREVLEHISSTVLVGGRVRARM